MFIHLPMYHIILHTTMDTIRHISLLSRSWRLECIGVIMVIIIIIITDIIMAVTITIIIIAGMTIIGITTEIQQIRFETIKQKAIITGATMPVHQLVLPRELVHQQVLVHPQVPDPLQVPVHPHVLQRVLVHQRVPVHPHGHLQVHVLLQAPEHPRVLQQVHVLQQDIVDLEEEAVIPAQEGVMAVPQGEVMAEVQ